MRWPVVAGLVVVACGGAEKKPDVKTDLSAPDAGGVATSAPDAGALVAAPPTTLEPATAPPIDAGVAVTPKVDEPPPSRPDAPLPEALTAFADATKLAYTDPERGIDAFRRITDADPTNARAHFNLGVLWERRGDKSRAEDAYRAALRARGDFAPAVQALATMRTATGGPRAALRVVEDSVARFPGSLELKNLQAYFKIQAGELDGAVALAKSVLLKEERNLAAIINMGAVFYQQGKTELAIFAFQNADAIDRENAKRVGPAHRRNAIVHYFLALCYLKVDNRDAAVVSLQEALSLRADYPEALNNLAALKNEKKDFRSAISLLEKALEYRPGFVGAVINLGNAYRGLEDFAKAIDHYEKARKLRPGIAEATFNLGIVYLDHDIKGMEPSARYKRALAEFSRYKEEMGAKLTAGDPVGRYVQEAEKRLKIEERKEKQREKKKADDAKKAAAAAAKKAAAEEAGAKKIADDAAALKKKEEEAAAKKKAADEEAARKKKAEEDAAKAKTKEGDKKLKRGGTEEPPAEGGGRKIKSKD